MAKQFYTEKDIEDMVRSGILTLQVSDNVVLTDLAYEKANKLGMKLVDEKFDKPPAAPVRPYLSQQNMAAPAPAAKPSSPLTAQPAYTAPQQAPKGEPSALQQRIHDAVIAKLGNQVDPVLLDTIIKRVLSSTGVK